ncbi:hypothetical protein T265_09516 [Opisthorchis viverrini]|uniref:Endonuclease/exonuclease/phosphatase domain-containing protein n=1 Tax=Opisthorchis viverrini TaxID=6198 RepID=A0A074ZGJ8_OPIVI|nr:hypothetical protein T265_09516 [Opisthorchis viverrini]KER22375.1 hypothetical protein T265_09516 [Opisthorchis viverrini]
MQPTPLDVINETFGWSSVGSSIPTIVLLFSKLQCSQVMGNRCKKPFSCSPLSVASFHANGRRHESWDTAMLPVPIQEQLRGRGRVRTTDFLVRWVFSSPSPYPPFSTVKSTDNETAISGINFFQDVILEDFPAEVFIQRPALVETFLGMIGSTKTQLMFAAARALSRLCEKLINRIYFHLDPNNHCLFPGVDTERCEMARWLVSAFTDRKVCGSNPISASRFPLSRLEQPGSIPDPVLTSGSMAVGHERMLQQNIPISFGYVSTVESLNNQIPGQINLMSSALRIYMYCDISNIVATETEGAWCSTFSRLGTLQTRDSAGSVDGHTISTNNADRLSSTDHVVRNSSNRQTLFASCYFNSLTPNTIDCDRPGGYPLFRSSCYFNSLTPNTIDCDRPGGYPLFSFCLDVLVVVGNALHYLVTQHLAFPTPSQSAVNHSRHRSFGITEVKYQLEAELLCLMRLAVDLMLTSVAPLDRMKRRTGSVFTSSDPEDCCTSWMMRRNPPARDLINPCDLPGNFAAFLEPWGPLLCALSSTWSQQDGMSTSWSASELIQLVSSNAVPYAYERHIYLSVFGHIFNLITTLFTPETALSVLPTELRTQLALALLDSALLLRTGRSPTESVDQGLPAYVLLFNSPVVTTWNLLNRVELSMTSLISFLERMKHCISVGVALSPKAESSLLDWIPVNSRLCAVRLPGSSKISAGRCGKRCLCVTETDEFYQDLSRLLRSARCTDIVILAGDVNAQVGRLSLEEAQLGGRFGVSAERTDNGSVVCRSSSVPGRYEFLAETHIPSYRGHMTITSRWRASVKDCRSFWGTQLYSDHATVRARLALRFPSALRLPKESSSVRQLRQVSVTEEYRADLARKLRETHSHVDDEDCLEDEWRRVSEAILSALRILPNTSDSTK